MAANTDQLESESKAVTDPPTATTSAASGVPEFEQMPETDRSKVAGSVDRFLDVHVPVWAELGRTEMPLGELMKLNEGSVVRLDRPVGEPVNLISQGVNLACGEVIVVDDHFAIRITEIDKPKTTG